ncbi:MAG: hypothetical protein Ta2E_07490 [Mycoplasmoidaceae bacterium]|nr:MAG: hypothetical protein Ta2E_07490 [Mycoplasmoidaceae bacterium]
MIKKKKILIFKVSATIFFMLLLNISVIVVLCVFATLYPEQNKFQLESAVYLTGAIIAILIVDSICLYIIVTDIKRVKLLIKWMKKEK